MIQPSCVQPKALCQGTREDSQIPFIAQPHPGKTQGKVAEIAQMENTKSHRDQEQGAGKASETALVGAVIPREGKRCLELPQQTSLGRQAYRLGVLETEAYKDMERQHAQIVLQSLCFCRDMKI